MKLYITLSLMVMLLGVATGQESIESINSRSRQALSEQIAQHVQSQLNNAFVRNQVFNKPPQQDCNQAVYPVSYQPTIISVPTVVTHVTSALPPPPLPPQTVTYLAPVSSVQSIPNPPPPIITSIPPPPMGIPPPIVVAPGPKYYPQPGTNTNSINGQDNVVNGQYNTVSGFSNTLHGSNNMAVGHKNQISGSVNTVSANKAIVQGHMNRVIESDIDINELF